MSLEAFTWALRREVSPTNKLILLALADYAKDNGVCWPGVDEVIRKSGFSKSTVYRGLKELSEGGFIEKVLWDERVVMRLTIDCPEFPEREKDSQPGNGQSQSETPLYREAVKESVKKQRPPPAVPSRDLGKANSLFERWRTKSGRNGKTTFDDKRKRLTLKALKNYSVEELEAAIDGCLSNDWHREHKQDDLALIFRDAAHIERFREMAPYRTKKKIDPRMTFEKLTKTFLGADGMDQEEAEDQAKRVMEEQTK